MPYLGKQPARSTLDSSDLGADVVTGAKIADDAVDSEHYTDGSIDNAHIADDAIDSEHYAAGSIDSAHLADDAVTLAKMAGGTDGNIISYDASGNPVAIATGSDGQVLTSTGAGSPPAFEAAGGGGGTALISSTNITAVNEIEIEDCFSATYDNYTILITGLSVTSDSHIKFTFRRADDVEIAGGYRGTLFDVYNLNATQSTGNQGLWEEYIHLNGNYYRVDNTDESRFSCIAQFTHRNEIGALANHFTFRSNYFNLNSAYNQSLGTQMSSDAGTVSLKTGFILRTSAGTFRARGKIAVYGWVMS